MWNRKTQKDRPLVRHPKVNTKNTLGKKSSHNRLFSLCLSCIVSGFEWKLPVDKTNTRRHLYIHSHVILATISYLRGLSLFCSHSRHLGYPVSTVWVYEYAKIQIIQITTSSEKMIYSFECSDMYIKRHLMTEITASVDKTDKFVDHEQILLWTKRDIYAHKNKPHIGIVSTRLESTRIRIACSLSFAQLSLMSDWLKVKQCVIYVCGIFIRSWDQMTLTDRQLRALFAAIGQMFATSLPILSSVEIIHFIYLNGNRKCVCF